MLEFPIPILLPRVFDYLYFAPSRSRLIGFDNATTRVRADTLWSALGMFVSDTRRWNQPLTL